MISDDDFQDIKKRLQADNIKFQFGVGTMEEAKNYVGKLGEPIVVKDKELFAICNGKDTANRKYYPINKSTKPPIGENINDYLKELVNWCLENTYPGFLTTEFAQEGTLSRSALIQAFEDTKKFCIPDGRSLPKGCFVKEKFGISSAPYLSGRFLRHYDPSGSTDSSGSRSLGDTQSDSFQRHEHRIDTSELDNLEGRLVTDYFFLKRDSNWSTGNTRFVTNLEYGDGIYKWNFPSYTDYEGSSETRPKNTCYISFYRYDW
ncbi:hypothetical protein [Borreliella bavariensis]|uniref:hypothetical protein n=1 Tax=Borreliella bavariensis TaxID=664662 RepID=UPI001BFFF02D|nr:hypothetical protein [Borreliella bavariensis]